MKIEILSNERCPFCYLGKKNEVAKEQFQHKEKQGKESDKLLNVILI